MVDQKVTRLELLRRKQKELQSKIALEAGKVRRKERAIHIKKLIKMGELFEEAGLLDEPVAMLRGALRTIAEADENTRERWQDTGENYDAPAQVTDEEIPDESVIAGNGEKKQGFVGGFFQR